MTVPSVSPSFSVTVSPEPLTRHLAHQQMTHSSRATAGQNRGNHRDGDDDGDDGAQQDTISLSVDDSAIAVREEGVEAQPRDQVQGNGRKRLLPDPDGEYGGPEAGYGDTDGVCMYVCMLFFALCM
jgi:hypothetical protein